MESLQEVIKDLQQRHRSALEWFYSQSGTIQPWPGPLTEGTLLASKAKGIYKPSWMKYALSIRQSLSGPYHDREPVMHDDGTWTFLYFQENADLKERDSKYTNRGLLECYRDQVPVGVIRQISGKPFSRYHVLGIAMVVGWEEGYFFLEGFSKDGRSLGRGPRPQIDAFAASKLASQEISEAFNPVNLADARARVTTSIVMRQGQTEFRRQLLDAYDKECAVSGCNIEEVLEAAHIVPYLGLKTNHLSNGILLRADIHTLFDLGLVAIDSSTMKLIISKRLLGTSYEELQGKQIAIPMAVSARPSQNAIDYHREWAGI